MPLAARLDGSSVIGGSSPSAPRIAVIGAGAFGGWTALQLLRRGAQVTLFDMWGAGNVRSSSGGETRVIRAIYGPDRIYSEMVKRAFELWEQLDAGSADPLYVETGTLWMCRGDDGYVKAAAPILRELDFPVEQLALDDAAKNYPQISFRGVKSVWLEHRAGALAAARCCIAVRHAFEQAGGTYRTARVAADLSIAGGAKIEADVYVFACGPWLGKLFPELIGDRIQPTRQEVYYFGTPPGSERYLPPHMPIWIDFGEEIFYGIPDVHGRGFKVADDTRGALFDPTTGDRTPSKEGIARARRLLAERFPELAKAPFVEAQVCQYENSPDGNLIIDRLPSQKNVWIAGGGSGHGFKLSPAVGDLLASAILGGVEIPPQFRLARLHENERRKTQFERKS